MSQIRKRRRHIVTAVQNTMNVFNFGNDNNISHKSNVVDEVSVSNFFNVREPQFNDLNDEQHISVRNTNGACFILCSLMCKNLITKLLF